MTLRNLRKQAKMTAKQNNLKERRLELKLTQKEVAEKLGLAEQVYQKYEYGMLPNVLIAIRIAEMLNTSVEELWK